MYHIFIVATILALSSCQKEDAGSQGREWPVIPEDEKTPFIVKSKETPSSVYKEYTTYSVKCIPEFSPKEPKELDIYGGDKSVQWNATGYFRVEKVNGRWWFVTPLGHPYIAVSVGELSEGGSTREKQAMNSKFGAVPVWAASEMDWLRTIGFNSIGKGVTSIIKDIPSRMPYCVFTMPMYNFTRYMQDNYGYKIPKALPVVFEDGYEDYIDQHLNWLTRYANDPFCIGVFTDNELYWVKNLLDRYITQLPTTSKSRQVAQEWLNKRKGKTGATQADINNTDREDFLAYCLDTYYQRTLSVLRFYDSNHLYIGERFYSWESDLVLPKMMQTAGKYMDVVTLNHYTKWNPMEEDLAKWESWSGRPIMITEFFTKGEDSGLPNNTGAGWIVPTQRDRGLFYENFIINLLKSGKCIGWSWFKYQDNDPEDPTVDESNIDSNKGLVKWNFERYDEMIELMKEANEQVYNLIDFYDSKRNQ